MALWKYVKREVKTPLPSSTGSLSKAISTDGIVAANKDVQRVMDYRRVLKVKKKKEEKNRSHISRKSSPRATCVDRAICEFLLLTHNLEIFSAKFSFKAKFWESTKFYILENKYPYCNYFGISISVVKITSN